MREMLHIEELGGWDCANCGVKWNIIYKMKNSEVGNVQIAKLRVKEELRLDYC